MKFLDLSNVGVTVCVDISGRACCQTTREVVSGVRRENSRRAYTL